MNPNRDILRRAAKALLLLCGLYAGVTSAGILATALRHPAWGGPADWAVSACWLAATIAMLPFRAALAARIGVYVGCMPLLYFIGRCVIAAVWEPHNYSRALADSYIVNEFMVVACLPLVFGPLIRVAIRNDRRTPPAPPPPAPDADPLAPDADPGSASDT